jgi:hypothetical protein
MFINLCPSFRVEFNFTRNNCVQCRLCKKLHRNKPLVREIRLYNFAPHYSRYCVRILPLSTNLPSKRTISFRFEPVESREPSGFFVHFTHGQLPECSSLFLTYFKIIRSRWIFRRQQPYLIFGKNWIAFS